MPADDLSEYERLRLENIRRNADFLASLGIKDVIQQRLETKEADKVAGKRKRDDREVRKRQEPVVLPTRRSLRVVLQQEGSKFEHADSSSVDEKLVQPTSSSGDGRDERRSYANMPFESDELDDCEFQVYVALKAWRLRRSRELDLEPYKICQNRTLAEIVRRCRNNIEWASSSKSEKDKENDLLDCWGIGPSKARKDGFGDLLINEINSSEVLLEHLARSRGNGDVFPTSNNDE